MAARLQLMQRMAERLGTLPDDQRPALLQQDTLSYFRDTLSLNAIALVDAQEGVVWSQGRQLGRDSWPQHARDSGRRPAQVARRMFQRRWLTVDGISMAGIGSEAVLQ